MAALLLPVIALAFIKSYNMFKNVKLEACYHVFFAQNEISSFSFGVIVVSMELLAF
jgi:hypothetical protein